MSDNEQTNPNLVRTSVARQWIPRLLMPVAIVVSVGLAANAWHDVKAKRHTIRVTGSATQRITSDLIEWDSSIQHTASSRAEAYRKVSRDVAEAVEYLKTQGLGDAEIRVSSAEVWAVFATEYEQVGDQAVSHDRVSGYKAQQTITVTSTEVEKVELLSREVTALIDRNIPIESSAPKYHYTGLEDLKIEMLAAASSDARVRAQRMLDAAGNARVGPITETHMGVININPANSTATSWEGNNDKTSLQKDIITVVHVTYEVD